MHDKQRVGSYFAECVFCLSLKLRWKRPHSSRYLWLPMLIILAMMKAEGWYLSLLIQLQLGNIVRWLENTNGSMRKPSTQACMVTVWLYLLSLHVGCMTPCEGCQSVLSVFLPSRGLVLRNTPILHSPAASLGAILLFLQVHQFSSHNFFAAPSSSLLLMSQPDSLSWMGKPFSLLK